MEIKRTWRERFHISFEDILYIGLAIGLAILIQSFIVRPFIVNGASMDPEFGTSDYLIIDEISYHLGHQYKRGDVITFKAPPEPEKYYIKRIIGLPGETIKITGAKVTIVNKQNPEGFVLDEPYIKHEKQDNLEIQIPLDHYFVMGDNRSGSYDSRAWGTVPKENIRGVALLRLLPLKKLAIFPGEEKTYTK
jgi:signal peptidase I